MKLCQVEGCEKPRRRARYCMLHQQRYRRHGNPLVVHPRGPAPQDRCWACNRPAPDGICTRPHPNLNYGAAKERGDVWETFPDVRPKYEHRLLVDRVRRAFGGHMSASVLR